MLDDGHVLSLDPPAHGVVAVDPRQGPTGDRRLTERPVEGRSVDNQRRGSQRTRTAGLGRRVQGFVPRAPVPVGTGRFLVQA